MSVCALCGRVSYRKRAKMRTNKVEKKFRKITTGGEKEVVEKISMGNNRRKDKANEEERDKKEKRERMKYYHPDLSTI